MRSDPRIVYRYRAAFGLGFVVLGGVTLYRVAVVNAPPNNKILGVLLALVMVGLGVVRLAQYARYRQG
jgi:hypothetical protein